MQRLRMITAQIRISTHRMLKKLKPGGREERVTVSVCNRGSLRCYVLVCIHTRMRAMYEHPQTRIRIACVHVPASQRVREHSHEGQIACVHVPASQCVRKIAERVQRMREESAEPDALPRRTHRCTTWWSWHHFTASHICRKYLDASFSENCGDFIMRSISSPPVASSDTIQNPLWSSIHLLVSIRPAQGSKKKSGLVTIC